MTCAVVIVFRKGDVLERLLKEYNHQLVYCELFTVHWSLKKKYKREEKMWLWNRIFQVTCAVLAHVCWVSAILWLLRLWKILLVFSLEILNAFLCLNIFYNFLHFRTLIKMKYWFGKKQSLLLFIFKLINIFCETIVFNSSFGLLYDLIFELCFLCRALVCDPFRLKKNKFLFV